MNPGLYFAIGRKARDLLYKDYAQPQPLQIRYQSYDWSFDFSCQIEEVLPGLNTVFRVVVPDSSQAELQYLRDYVGFSAGIGLKANSAHGFDPIANISGVIGSTVVSLGADLGIDITTRTLNKFSAGLSLNSAFLIASMTLSDSCDSVKASVYHPLNPPTMTAIAAELKHRISRDATTLTFGAQHALLPYTLVKARMNTDGKVSAVLRQEIWQRFYLSIAGELDLRDNNSIPRIGLSMAIKH
ncbi:mitochondrial outer membrane protein porin of 36 kDa-like [Gossypium australe]|uniref:Mitochondrial outer membrane protein porin of 36 kDa-like n=1 Tax=Gossypium australe TaxID=47621 RepID=A0A5B6V2D6_9ROSI|nr:mitochondrial outer membrane protein porin of 36 kDa-like [Gossypium australe]